MKKLEKRSDARRIMHYAKNLFVIGKIGREKMAVPAADLDKKLSRLWADDLEELFALTRKYDGADFGYSSVIGQFLQGISDPLCKEVGCREMRSRKSVAEKIECLVPEKIMEHVETEIVGYDCSWNEDRFITKVNCRLKVLFNGCLFASLPPRWMVFGKYPSMDMKTVQELVAKELRNENFIDVRHNCDFCADETLEQLYAYINGYGK